MENWNVFKFIMIFVVLVNLTGCADEDFNKAKMENTVAAYNNFLKNYPYHALSKEARDLREPLMCEEAKRENTVKIYLSYLQQYPYGNCAPEEIRLISQLSSDNEDDRDRAANFLSKFGEELSKALVEEIINIMRHGRKKWSKRLYRQSHCTWYEDITVKYYAAKSLENMKSPYVSDEIVREARNVRNRKKTKYRVTDPGWICY